MGRWLQHCMSAALVLCILLPAAAPAALEAAEERERRALSGAPATVETPQLSKEEQLRRQIEASKYE